MLLKETFRQKRFFNESNYFKNVDAILALKKSCYAMTKFATQNISPAIVQVCSGNSAALNNSLWYSGNINAFLPYLIHKAVTLAVYCFGCLTVLARTFSKEEAPVSIAMIAYIPLLPAMQV